MTLFVLGLKRINMILSQHHYCKSVRIHIKLTQQDTAAFTHNDNFYIVCIMNIVFQYSLAAAFIPSTHQLFCKINPVNKPLAYVHNLLIDNQFNSTNPIPMQIEYHMFILDLTQLQYYQIWDNHGQFKLLLFTV